MSKSSAQRQAWAKLSPYMRAYRGYLIAMGHHHRNCIIRGNCDCDKERERRMPALEVMKRQGAGEQGKALNKAPYNTPTQLQQHGVRANQGTAMMPRGWMAYADQETKKYLLRVAWILPASKAITRPGDAPKVTDAASQLLLGLMLGQDRSTTNRDLRMFCGDDAQVANFFHKMRPGIGMVNHYAERRKKDEPQPSKKEVLNNWNPPRLVERYGPQHFNAEAKGLDGCGPVALWTFDENMPEPQRCGCRKGQMKFNFSSNCMKCGGKGYTLDPKKKMGANARVFLAMLQLKGIVTNGWIERTDRELGELCGLSENTVAEVKHQWEDLKVLQIVPGRVVADRAGAVVYRYPQRLIWLPGLLLDHAMIERERQRFLGQLAETRELAQLNGWACAGVHLDRIAALHNELLSRWAMSRHSLGAFWNAMRMLIYRERMPSGRLTGDAHDYRSYLFPVHLE